MLCHGKIRVISTLGEPHEMPEQMVGFIRVAGGNLFFCRFEMEAFDLGLLSNELIPNLF